MQKLITMMVKRLLQRNLLEKSKPRTAPPSFTHCGCWRVSRNRLCDINLEDAIALFNDMVNSRPFPSVIDFNRVLNAIVKLKNCFQLSLALSLLGKMLKLGYEPDRVTLGSLVNGFCRRNKVSDAVSFVQKMVELGVFVIRVDGVMRRLLSEMMKRRISPNVITYIALIDAFVKNGKVLEAKELYEEMIRMSIEPDVVTYSSLINGFCMQDRIDEASEMFDLMVSKGCFPDVVSYNTLINGFCKSKRVEDGMKLFREMSKRGLSDIWTYNILLGGLCDNGELEKALVIFEDMQKREMNLDITGKIEDAWGLFCSLSLKRVKPDAVAYTTMMSCLCRKGLHREIDELYTQMKEDGLMLNDGTLCIRDGDITVSAELIQDMLSRGSAPSRGCKKVVSLV
ncbi:hypothetical protein N665_0388s0002 [Sinapis alba]|nr:hypothetical protein N665_0388s0002 [Sinapis alba]